MRKNFFELAGTPQNLNEFIQKLPLPVAAINVHKEIVAYNRAFFLLAGREIRQGTHYCHEFLNFSFCHDNCLADMAGKMKKTINWDESRGHRKNGDEIIVRPIVFPMMDEKEELRGHLLLFLDTTDEVQLYQNFRANLDHLERKVSFLQTLNEVADQFRKITQVDLLLGEIVKFAVQNLSLECCQVVQHDETKGFYSLKLAIADDFERKIENDDELLEGLHGILESFGDTQKDYLVHQFEEDTKQGRKESIALPIQSGNSDYGFLLVHRFREGEGVSSEQLEYLDLYAKSIGPYIENCHIITNLESIVMDRTRELQAAQAQLMESTRMASVGEMAGMVAHEVLNPITAIMARVRQLQQEEGSVSFLEYIINAWKEDYQKGGIDELVKNFKEVVEGEQMTLLEEDFQNLDESVVKIKHDLNFLYEHLNRIVRIVDNLRGLSRTQTMDQDIDIKDIISKTADLTYDEFKKRQTELDIQINHTSNVACDSNELIQVLHNLFRNAMQAVVKQGKITVTTSETEDRVEIRVKDSGAGIPEEVAPKIFEMRFTTKSASEGTGMGLNLSRRLMRQVKGDLELDSRGGNGEHDGAVFLCWIPKKSK